jgi:hypothetical protein
MVVNVDCALSVTVAAVGIRVDTATEDIMAVWKVICLGNQQNRRRYVQKHQETDG